MDNNNSPPNSNYSLEAEQSVIGGLILKNDALTDVSNVLSLDDFYDKRHQLLFKAIQNLASQGQPFDLVTLGVQLQKDGTLNAIGGGPYLGQLAGNTPSAANIMAYARIVKKKSINRQAIVLASNPLENADKLLALRDAKTALTRKGDKSMSLSEWRKREVSEPQYIIDPILKTHSETIIYAESGVGKTLLITDLGFAMSCSGRALKWDVPKPRRVLIVDGEMPVALLKQRYDELVERNNGLEPELMRIVSALDYEEDMDLIKPEWQAEIDAIIKEQQIEVLILDNLDALFNLDQLKQTDWLPAKAWLKRLRNQGMANILVHHANRQKTIFGTSALSRQPDNVIALLRPEDYSQEEGAVFDVRFDKARGLFGEDVAPFRASLNEYGWKIEESILSVKGLKGAIIDAILEGNEHYKDIAVELDKSVGLIKKTLSLMVKDKLIESQGSRTGKYMVLSQGNLGNQGNQGNLGNLGNQAQNQGVSEGLTPKLPDKLPNKLPKLPQVTTAEVTKESNNDVAFREENAQVTKVTSKLPLSNKDKGHGKTETKGKPLNGKTVALREMLEPIEYQKVNSLLQIEATQDGKVHDALYCQLVAEFKVQYDEYGAGATRALTEKYHLEYPFTDTMRAILNKPLVKKGVRRNWRKIKPNLGDDAEVALEKLIAAGFVTYDNETETIQLS